MPPPDRRPRFREAVFASPVLNSREKVYLLRVSTIAAENRPGSRPMGPDGKFALHIDYVAASLGVSADTIRRSQEACRRKGFLHLVRAGTHGYPSTYQALIPEPHFQAASHVR